MQNNPTYESNSADVGSGAEAFEMFESGASIEEINAKFFLSGSGSEPDKSDMVSAASDVSTADVNDDVRGSGADDSAASRSDSRFESQTASSSEGADSSEHAATVHQADAGDNAGFDSAADADASGQGGSDEKKFSQADVDSIVGRAKSREKGARDRLQNELSGVMQEVADFFGVGTDNALEVLRNEKYRREAESKGIDDADMYSRLQRAERELAQLKEVQETEKKQQFVNGFLAEVENQLSSYVAANPGVNVSEVTADENFNRLLKDLYVNPVTKDRCVEIAFGAFGGEGLAPAQAPAPAAPLVSQADRRGQRSMQREGEPGEIAKKAAAIDANRKRAAESASALSNAPQAQTLDYDNMSLDDFKKLGERAARGEIIVPSI